MQCYSIVAHCVSLGSYHYIVYIDTQEGDTLIDTKQETISCP